MMLQLVVLFWIFMFPQVLIYHLYTAKSEEKAKKKKFRAKHFNREALFYDRYWIFLTWFQFVKNAITIENYFKDFFLMEITTPV